MKYYRVIRDLKLLTARKNGYYKNDDAMLFKNELYTEKEFEKVVLHHRAAYERTPLYKVVEVVDIPKNKTYFQFGARFEVGTGVRE